MFNKKKNSQTQPLKTGSYPEYFGKTEPVGIGSAPSGDPFFVPNGNIDAVQKTVPPTGADTLIDSDELFRGASNVIEDYGHTQPSDTITLSNGESIEPVVGWLVCIKGVNLGKEFRIHSGYNYIGSASGDVIIRGDPKISREKHMQITYDSEGHRFYVSPASGANIIYVNDDCLVAGARPLSNYDVIRTGDSAFMFIGFCGENFGWEQVANG